MVKGSNSMGSRTAMQQCTMEVAALPKEETTPGHAATLEDRHGTNKAAREKEVCLGFLLKSQRPMNHVVPSGTGRQSRVPTY